LLSVLTIVGLSASHHLENNVGLFQRVQSFAPVDQELLNGPSMFTNRMAHDTMSTSTGTSTGSRSTGTRTTITADRTLHLLRGKTTTVEG
jgi:hypothetical protein